MGTFNPNSIPDTDTTKKPPRGSTSNVKNDTSKNSASRSTGFSNRGEPVRYGKSDIQVINSGSMASLLSSEDIKVAKGIKDLENLTEEQKKVVERIKTTMSETSVHQKITNDTVMNVIETFKGGSMHAEMFGMSPRIH